MLHIKFGFDWPKRFQRRRSLKMVDDGRTPDHGHPISSPCEPNGSGELKSWVTIYLIPDSKYRQILSLLSHSSLLGKFTDSFCLILHDISKSLVLLEIYIFSFILLQTKRTVKEMFSRNSSSIHLTKVC